MGKTAERIIVFFTHSFLPFPSSLSPLRPPFLLSTQIFISPKRPEDDDKFIPYTTVSPALDNFLEAGRSYNIDKNRFRDVLPYDRTRVRLQPIVAQLGSDYINASHVAVCIARILARFSF